MVKSPFFVHEDALSPAKCEQLIDELGLRVPSLNESGKPLKHERIMKDVKFIELVQSILGPLQPLIEERYDALVKGMETPLFQQYFENPSDPCEHHGCESSKFMRKKWVKAKDVDLVGFIWLKDYNGGVPLDPRFEVYGGKLEFPAYNFSLVPQRGTLVLYPAGPHFITAISPVLVGELEQLKITLKLQTTGGDHWLYQPANFPGTYQEWFTQET